jgi:hypothetical protein
MALLAPARRPGIIRPTEQDEGSFAVRLIAAAVSVVLFGAFAWAQEGSPPPAPAPEAVAPAAPAPAAPKQRKTRYVNAAGEELICKPISGTTGTRLKGRAKLMCGTQAEWDDTNSDVRRLFDEMVVRNTPRPKG